MVGFKKYTLYMTNEIDEILLYIILKNETDDFG